MKHHLFLVLYNIFLKKIIEEWRQELYKEDKFIVTHISSVKNKK